MLARIRKSMEEKDEGFTLIELLVVIIIIGILAAIAIPVFLNQRKKGYDAQAKSDVRNVAIAVESYFTDASPQVYPTLVVNGAEPAAPVASTVYYRKSPATSAMTVVNWVNAAGTAADLTGAVGFCIETTSQSGATFAYNSSLGGVQAKGSTCP
ncbi:MAG: prepilin-type N-terminal cleavage/methylation domain-containing protein [Actinomycetota bacterium]|nr:prepilin-type N-terminal cleavage/methylation domain-containing protein [Actinomycetota bacterium]